ncbi:MAG: DUF1631 family protein [Rubrivivax sp.]
MKVSSHRRLPAQLEAAAHRLKLAARAAVDRTVESLGLAALSAPNLVRRDDLLAAQFELNRKSAVFTLAFNEAFDEWIAREAQPVGEAAAAPKATNWDALSLVEDHEVERKITAERFAQDVISGCEWELRELDGYVGSLLGQVGETAVRNPLRPEVIGHAVIRGVAAVSERAEVRKVLQTELSRSIGSELRATYADIVSRLRSAGVQPLSLAVRQRQQRVPGSGPGAAAGPALTAATSPPSTTRSGGRWTRRTATSGAAAASALSTTRTTAAAWAAWAVSLACGGGGMPLRWPGHAAAYAGGYAGRGGGAAGAAAHGPWRTCRRCCRSVAAARATVATVAPPGTSARAPATAPVVPGRVWPPPDARLVMERATAAPTVGMAPAARWPARRRAAGTAATAGTAAGGHGGGTAPASPPATATTAAATAAPAATPRAAPAAASAAARAAAPRSARSTQR